jgi:hypothetical protein
MTNYLAKTNMVANPNKNYVSILSSLKEKIRQARLQAALTVNAELLQLYWQIGNTILQQQKKEGWGTKVIDSTCNGSTVCIS